MSRKSHGFVLLHVPKFKRLQSAGNLHLEQIKLQRMLFFAENLCYQGLVRAANILERETRSTELLEIQIGEIELPYLSRKLAW